jgi:DNA-binding MarR family transcriptional regulator
LSAGAGQPERHPVSERGEALRLERFLPYRLVVAASLGSGALARLYGAQFGIDIPEWRVMATLGEFGRLTARDVGRLTHMHKTKVSRAVTALSTRGLVARAPNTHDRREAFLSLTAPGQRVYGAIVPLALGFEQRLIEDLPAADLAAFERVLTALTERTRFLAAGVAGEED